MLFLIFFDFNNFIFFDLFFDLFFDFVFLRVYPPDVTGGGSVKKFNFGIDITGDGTGDGRLVPIYSTSGEGGLVPIISTSGEGGLVPIYSTSGDFTGDILFAAALINGDAADTSLYGGVYRKGSIPGLEDSGDNSLAEVIIGDSNSVSSSKREVSGKGTSNDNNNACFENDGKLCLM
jgi:hypothetical protein